MTEEQLTLLERLIDLHIEAGTTIDYQASQDIDNEAEFIRKQLIWKSPDKAKDDQ